MNLCYRIIGFVTKSNNKNFCSSLTFSSEFGLTEIGKNSQSSDIENIKYFVSSLQSKHYVVAAPTTCKYCFIQQQQCILDAIKYRCKGMAYDNRMKRGKKKQSKY